MGSAFEVPLLENVADHAGALGEDGFEFLLLLLDPPLSLLVVHVGVGALPDGVSGEEDVPGELYFVLELLPLPRLFLVLLPLLSLLPFAFGRGLRVFLAAPAVALHLLVEGFVAVVEVFLFWSLLGLGVVLSGMGLLGLVRVEVVVLVVVVLKLLGGEYVVGFLDFCELEVASGVDVGMQFLGEAEVGLPDVMLGGIPLNLEDLIIVFLQINVFGGGA